MRSKAIFMALLALAFGAQAASVSQEEAVLAARGWVADGGALGTYIGQGVESAATHVTTNGATFYSVKMWGGGTLFTRSLPGSHVTIFRPVDGQKRQQENANLVLSSPEGKLRSLDSASRQAATIQIARMELPWKTMGNSFGISR